MNTSFKSWTKASNVNDFSIRNNDCTDEASKLVVGKYFGPNSY